MDESIGDWLVSELDKRGWSHNELARRASLSQPAVSGIVGGRKPSADFCIKVALVLDEPPEKVLRLAGILPPSSENDPTFQELIDLAHSLPPDRRQQLLDYAQYLLKLGK